MTNEMEGHKRETYGETYERMYNLLNKYAVQLFKSLYSGREDWSDGRPHPAVEEFLNYVMDSQEVILDGHDVGDITSQLTEEIRE